MKKNISAVLEGRNILSGGLLTNRLLPAPGLQAVGPIVLIEHTYPTTIAQGYSSNTKGLYTYPRRGVVACTYILEGSLLHLDSTGSEVKIGEGGFQWLHSGSGVLVDEFPGIVTKSYHSLQFWINLPKAIKSDPPEHVSIPAAEIPEILLPDHAGTIRILMGDFGSVVSPVSIFRNEFMYHIRLNPRSEYTFSTRDARQYAAFVPSVEVSINGSRIGKSKIVIFGTAGNDIHLVNDEIFPADLFIFGGEEDTEGIVAQGPFVMNSYAELAGAYRDFFAGNYGIIVYP